MKLGKCATHDEAFAHRSEITFACMLHTRELDRASYVEWHSVQRLFTSRRKGPIGKRLKAAPRPQDIRRNIYRLELRRRRGRSASCRQPGRCQQVLPCQLHVYLRSLTRLAASQRTELFRTFY